MKISRLKHYLSYLADFSIERTASKHNTLLEVRYYLGRYMLDTENANYSFGRLHKVFDFAFQKLMLKKRNINNALILGYGAGSVTLLLNKIFGNLSITGVEHDEVVIDMAKKYFGLSEMNNVKMINSDAIDFLKQCEEKFDLTVIDLFEDKNVPEVFCTEDFFIKLEKTLAKNGLLIFNRMICDAGMEPAKALREFQQEFPSGYHFFSLNNLILVFENKGLS